MCIRDRITGARSLWIGCQPEMKQRIYYANHNSHIDFILLWSSLPKLMRRKTKPVAASDYWLKDGFRQFLIKDTFNGVTIQRNREDGSDPLQPVKDALAQGYSIIFFPEGTRNLDDDVELLPFKSGLYNLHKQFPEIEIVPVWISNLRRVMPKGSFIPLPLLSTCLLYTSLVILWDFYRRQVQGSWKYLVDCWSALIGLSILTTWQHHLIDLPTGCLLYTSRCV